MNNPTHTLQGATAAAIAADHLASTPTGIALVIAGGLLGALLPDVDHPGAKIHSQTRIERDSLLIGVLGAVARLPLRLASLLPHRGPPTHGFPAITWVITGALAIHAEAGPAIFLLAAGIAAGYLAHLWGDGATLSGLPGWPFCHRIYTMPRFLRIRTERTPNRGERRYQLATAILAVAYGALIFTP